MKIKFLLASILAAFVLTACDNKTSTPAAPTTPAASTTPAPAAPAPATPPAAAPEAAPAAPEAAPAAPEAAPAATSSLGVPECDDYINKMMACYESKIPEAQRAAMVQGLEQVKAGWAQVPKDALVTMCKQAMEAGKTQFAAMGCTF